MRPVRRNASSISEDFDDYTAAKPYLVSRLGPYCSYCERRISTQLAVEHIQPKGVPQIRAPSRPLGQLFTGLYQLQFDQESQDCHLGRCIAAGSRDNTFAAFDYSDDVDMRRRLVNEFEGTSASGCFDPVKVSPVSPAANPDGLPFGGKI